ncbi:cellulose biosynthesis cyclic di-GMP-binding regulatory protein BcsB [Paenibacillus sp. 481]|uniref:cellulose biosynthesis cyclic di-GMP-binding regulatory protein BcsB n=1 Tax=Paenibacillus sp. 481 TaxID=2835869 RepID=UPI001E626513|nr:cellulose biosynthesis cyclic di-GMP-binding regulatory protein BcsB [Paenibacillus sp. 481]UHA74406.1 cellulose biosynthesis cyclic di-GMP-binding regulatory protein BcsB [Paenibacillus sp. 481]
MKRWIGLGLVLVIMFSSFHVPLAHAEESPTLPSQVRGTEPFTLFPQDVVIRGLTHRQDYYFDVNSNRGVSPRSYAELQVSHSSTLLSRRSTMTVMLDDVPLETRRLDPSNANRTTWRIDFAGAAVKSGFHKLSIVTQLSSTDDWCVDETNVGNWAVLHKESVLVLDWTKREGPTDLSWYPSPFFEKGTLKPWKTLFVLPDKPSETELKTLVELAAFFGKQQPGGKLAFNAATASELTDERLQGINVIMIGSNKGWKINGKQFYAQTEVGRTSGAGGAIRLYTSPWDDNKVVLTVQGTDDELKKAALALTEAKVHRQFVGTKQDIKTLVLPEQAAAQKSNDKRAVLTLEQLGYNDMTVEGPQSGSAVFTFTVPPALNITSDAVLKLRYRHSQALKFSQSLMMVKVNGSPVSSRYLSAETSQGATLEVPIPNGQLANRIINVEVTFQFISTKEGCTQRVQTGQWAVVDKGSSLTLPVRPNQSVALDYLPYPFVNNGLWQPTVVLLPDSLNERTLTLLATWGGSIGKHAQTAIHDWQYIAASKAKDDAIKDKHIVALGTGAQLASVERLWSKAPIWPGPAELQVRDPNAVPLLPDTREKGAMAALARSPLNDERYVLVMSGAQEAALQRLTRWLTEPAAPNAKTQGQAIVIDRLNRVHNFAAAEQAQQPPSDAANLLQPQTQPVWMRFVWICVFAVILVAVGVLLWRNRKQKHDK